MNLTHFFIKKTEKKVPHYDETAWNWLKGALATIDRNYHPVIDALHYQIGTTHVVHHLFHELPHYNAKEANVYIKQVLGDLYNSD
jgi:fatty acid desaturase